MPAARENGRVVQVYDATTWNRTTREMGSAVALDVQYQGKGLGEKNVQFHGMFATHADAWRWMAEWAEAGYPETVADWPAEEATDGS